MLHTISSPEQEYQFVEQPSEDFFCPVTYDLLLQPHLTECCGKHLSQYAATMIKDAGDPCPMCKETNLSTMLDRHLMGIVCSVIIRTGGVGGRESYLTSMIMTNHVLGRTLHY